VSPTAHYFCDECWAKRRGEVDPIRVRVDPAVPCCECARSLTLPALAILSWSASEQLPCKGLGAGHEKDGA